MLSVDLFFTQMGVSTSFFTVLGHYHASPKPISVKNAQDSTYLYYLGGWVALTIVFALIRSYQSGDLHKWNIFITGGYHRLPSGPDHLPEFPKKSRHSAPQRTFSYPDTLEFNYFDPDALPKTVQVYAELIFSAVQALSAEIGFQVCEALCSRLVRSSSDYFHACGRWIIPGTKRSIC